MAESLTLCDLTQSYSAAGGGIRTYLSEKRKFIAAQTPHRHVLIVPGAEDHIMDEGRLSLVTIKSPKVPGSPNYRLLLRNKAVRRTLALYAPDTIECLDAYNLPWAAIKHRKAHPQTALIAGYRTDFPTVYVEGLTRKLIGRTLSGKLKSKAYDYAGGLYARFDATYALNPHMARRLEALGAGSVDVLPLGTDLSTFSPAARDENWRRELGAGPADPVLIYAGRIDKEKQADVVVEAFLRLPLEMKAHLVMLGDGGLRESLAQKVRGRTVHFPGYVSERADLARYLASSDIYVSAMAFETFGISIIEAQACGLPVVGVKAGAMPDRVPDGLGRLGPVSDPVAMRDNIVAIWSDEGLNDMRARARQHVTENYSWTQTFAHLFGHIYPRAMGRAGAII